MFKVMIVDDDYPVVQFLESSIAWDKLQLQISGAHSNSLEALADAQSNPPHILLTDIGMPHMNGLELIEAIQQKQPQLKVIILSCLDDFEFARKAMKLHVQDYILKESFKPIDVEDMLQVIAEQLRAEHAELKEIDHWKRAASGHMPLRKNAFIEQTLEGVYVNEQTWISEAIELGFQFDQYAYAPVLCLINEMNTVKSRFGSERLLMSAIDNIMTEVLENVDGTIFTVFDAKQYMIWFPCPPARAVFLKHHLHRLQDALQTYLKIKTSYIMGTCCKSFAETRRSLHALINNNNVLFYLDNCSIVEEVPFWTEKESIGNNYNEAAKQFLETLFEQNEQKMEQVWRHWYTLIQANHYPPEDVKEWMLKILFEIEEKLKLINPNQASPMEESFHQTILEMDTLEQLHEWTLQFISRIIPLVSLIYKQAKKPEIIKAQRYIEQRITSKISLDEIANELHMNPSYFSRLFRKETGETFVEYVTKLKIERAKELLRWSNSSIETISESLGYDNKSYFSKLFKSVCGITPGEYREQSGH